jgi:hypothetical protein
VVVEREGHRDLSWSKDRARETEQGREKEARFDVHGGMFTCPLYTEHKNNSGTYIPGVGLGRLDDRRLIVVFLGRKGANVHG